MNSNYLDYIPLRTIQHETGENGRLVLLKPKFKTGFLKVLEPYIKRKFYRVHLDRLGSATWEAIDGRHSVGQIADSLYEQFGDIVEPRYERLAKFMRSLDRGMMIGYKRKE